MKASAENELRAAAEGVRAEVGRTHTAFESIPQGKLPEPVGDLLAHLDHLLDKVVGLVDGLVEADRLFQRYHHDMAEQENYIVSLEARLGETDRTAAARRVRQEKAAERQRLAREWRERGLSITQIALKMERPERSISRWLAKKP